LSTISINLFKEVDLLTGCVSMLEKSGSGLHGARVNFMKLDTFSSGVL
jgi:hypothetical protein